MYMYKTQIKSIKFNKHFVVQVYQHVPTGDDGRCLLFVRSLAGLGELKRGKEFVPSTGRIL